MTGNKFKRSKFIKVLKSSTDAAKDFFHDESEIVSRQDFQRRGYSGAHKKCGVYAYCDSNNVPLYIGQTTGSIFSRKNYPTSNHTKKDWWGKWENVLCFNIEDESEQRILEALLILAYKPVGNMKFNGMALNEMFLVR